MIPKIAIVGYSNDVGANLAHASAAAYLSRDEIAMQCGKEGGELINYIEDAKTGTECFVATRDGDLLIAFRGTQDAKDWITDAKFRRTSWDGGSVHRGFAAAYNSVSEQIRKALTDAAVNGGGISRLWLTGHSLGGALATLCALDMRMDGYYVDGVYTFGSPRVGDSNFATYYNYLLRDRTFRITNGNDVVTRLPAFLAGYKHVGQEVFWDQFGEVRLNPKWWSKIPGDIWGFAAELNLTFPPATLMKIFNDHPMTGYLKLLQK